MFEEALERLRVWLGCSMQDLTYIEQLELELIALREQRDAAEAKEKAQKSLVERYKKMCQALLEPQPVGGCRKIRHQSRGLAVTHAERIAGLSPGERFDVYQCRVCTQPITNTPYWHVGHSRYGSIQIDYGCICTHAAEEHERGRGKCQHPRCICGEMVFRRIT
jgi:hypothetical protein